MDDKPIPEGSGKEENGDSAREEVNSKAVVKYSSSPLPQTFLQLQCNTNLNLPPANWLQHFNDSYGMQQSQSPLGLASFNMLHMSPDCLGEVDVVSSAENIKRLLKMPYSFNSPISLIVHRVSNTILIDDFDFHKYLLRQSKTDWPWLKSFISTILKSFSEKDRQSFQRNITGQNVQQEGALIQKFLSHSLAEAKPANEDSQSHEVNVQELRTPSLVHIPVLPKPNLEEIVSDPEASHSFDRNVLWTFEDIRMLIGTDLPIFGSERCPCISLRLRDMKEPINVLTGIDYWLDNLMCNVPDVLMCYHLDGMVQEYDLVKTVDLPNMENSKFSPKLIRNVAQNILTFLKQNATKSGHTYWLLKGPHDDVVKLYDLTTLCAKTEREEAAAAAAAQEAKPTGDEKTATPRKDQNPFTNPVAMLLYSVAYNMKTSREHLPPKMAGSVKALLENCIKLLPTEKYPRLVTSSHYMLSDLFIPNGVDPMDPKFETTTDADADSIYDDKYDDYNDLGKEDNLGNDDENDNFNSNIPLNQANIAIQDTLSDQSANRKKYNSRPPALEGSLEERCQDCLEHILNGLKCLKFFKTSVDAKTEKEKKDRIVIEEQNLNMARPGQAIPLPYETLKPKKTAQAGRSKKARKKDKKIPVSKQKEPVTVKVWDVHLKVLLLEKACLTYAILAENNYGNDKFGLSLKYIRLALNCQKAVINHLSSLQYQKCNLLGRAGDCYFQTIKKFGDVKEIQREFHTMSDVDKEIQQEIQAEISEGGENEEICEPKEDIEHLLLASNKCYELAIKLSKKNTLPSLLGRLGNVLNELGVKNMCLAQCAFQETAADQEPVYESLLERSINCFRQAIDTFEQIHDVSNLSLVYSNVGRLYRLQAHIMFIVSDPHVRLQCCAAYYERAATYYEKALQSLGAHKLNPELWEIVTWELSTSNYSVAKLFFDACTGTRESLNKVLTYLQTAQENCDRDPNSCRHNEYVQRSGSIYFMIGHINHRLLKLMGAGELKKKMKSHVHLVEWHYNNSLVIYKEYNLVKEFLNVLQHKVLHVQWQIGQTANVNLKVKLFHTTSTIIDQALALLSETTAQVTFSDAGVLKSLVAIESSLNAMCKDLIKIYIQNPTSRNATTNRAALKKLFSRLLRSTPKDESVQELVQVLLNNFKLLQSDFDEINLL